MKIAIISAWAVFALSILVFIISIFTASTQTTWTVFSVAVPLAVLSFWIGLILTIIEIIRASKK